LRQHIWELRRLSASEWRREQGLLQLAFWEYVRIGPVRPLGPHAVRKVGPVASLELNLAHCLLLLELVQSVKPV
jgi:hypothetical protein